MSGCSSTQARSCPATSSKSSPSGLLTSKRAQLLQQLTLFLPVIRDSLKRRRKRREEPGCRPGLASICVGLSILHCFLVKIRNFALNKCATDSSELHSVSCNTFPMQAHKFLPYGFGPGKMVILDAAEFDDDEEEYGDYQVREKLCLHRSFPCLLKLFLRPAKEIHD